MAAIETAQRGNAKDCGKYCGQQGKCRINFQRDTVHKCEYDGVCPAPVARCRDQKQEQKDGRHKRNQDDRDDSVAQPVRCAKQCFRLLKHIAMKRGRYIFGQERDDLIGFRTDSGVLNIQYIRIAACQMPGALFRDCPASDGNFCDITDI